MTFVIAKTRSRLSLFLSPWCSTVVVRHPRLRFLLAEWVLCQ